MAAFSVPTATVVGLTTLVTSPFILGQINTLLGNEEPDPTYVKVIQGSVVFLAGAGAYALYRGLR